MSSETLASSTRAIPSQRKPDSELPGDHPFRRFLYGRGPRYHDCWLSNFELHGSDGDRHRQQVVIDGMRDYLRNVYERFEEGENLLFCGPVGTGKDHLMVASVRALCTAGIRRRREIRVQWKRGTDLFGEIKEAIGRKDARENFADYYGKPDVLVISDPASSSSELSDWDTNVFNRIIDQRYSDRKPTWVTINAMDSAGLSKAVGAANADRLRDRAKVVICNWRSFRDPREANVEARKPFNPK